MKYHFWLHRQHDANAISGEGYIADGEYDSRTGRVRLVFDRTPYNEVIFNSVEAVLDTYAAHPGTEIVWDGDDLEALQEAPVPDGEPTLLDQWAAL